MTTDRDQRQSATEEILGRLIENGHSLRDALKMAGIALAPIWRSFDGDRLPPGQPGAKIEIFIERGDWIRFHSKSDMKQGLNAQDIHCFAILMRGKWRLIGTAFGPWTNAELHSCNAKWRQIMPPSRYLTKE